MAKRERYQDCEFLSTIQRIFGLCTYAVFFVRYTPSPCMLMRVLLVVARLLTLNGDTARRDEVPSHRSGIMTLYSKLDVDQCLLPSRQHHSKYQVALLGGVTWQIS